MRPIRIKAKARKQPEPGTMSSAEKAYRDQVLEPQRGAGAIIGYKFQPIKFQLAKKTSYTPDFMVTMPDGEIRFLEIKGSWKMPHQDDSRVKLKVAAEMFWQFAFFSVVVVPKKDGGGWKTEAII